MFNVNVWCLRTLEVVYIERFECLVMCGSCMGPS